MLKAGSEVSSQEDLGENSNALVSQRKKFRIQTHDL